MSQLTLSVGLAHKFEIACSRNGLTLADVDRLCEGDILAQFRKVLLGHAAITPLEYIIDCDATPFVPDGWGVEEHRKSDNSNGLFGWDAGKIELYLDYDQQGGRYVEGRGLRKRLTARPVLNANVLDYLLKNPQLIPESWKNDERGNTRYIFFWGTIYRRFDGNLFVRYLYWFGGWWRWDAYWLDRGWGGNDPAALRVS